MKISVRILAAFLLASILLCSLPVTSFAQAPSLEELLSELTSGDVLDEHQHDGGETRISSPEIHPEDIVWEDKERVDTVVGTGISGDINGDGTVNNMDAILLYRFVLGEAVSVDTDALDIDGNGLVNNDDVLALYRYVSGWTEVEIGYGYGWATECAHAELTYIPAVTASCTEDGAFAYWHCQSCGLAFEEADCKKVISDADIVISKYSQHVFDEWVQLFAPSCTEKGIKRHICTGCGYEETVEIERTEHEVDDYFTQTEPTCDRVGILAGECSICFNTVEVEIPALGHKAGDPVDTVGEFCLDRAVGTICCVRCNEVISSYGHNYVTTVTDATCTEDGSVTKECTRCHVSQTTPILHEGHLEGFLVTVKPATCTAVGEVAIGCLYCDYIFDDSRSELPIIEHELVITETEEYFLIACKSCSYSYTEGKGDFSVHKITLISTHGAVPVELLAESGKSVQLPLLSADGFAFYGWYTDEACEQAFDAEFLESDVTLYAKWVAQDAKEGSDGVLSGVSDDFSFTVKMSDESDPSALEDLVLVMDLLGNVVSMQAEALGDGVYRISPEENYQKGGVYKVVLRGDTEFADYDSEELWFTTKKEDTSYVSVHAGVVQIDSADVFSLTEGDADSWFLLLYDDVLNVNSYFVVYEGDESNILYSGRVYEEGVFDRYHVYRIDELLEGEFSEVFETIDIYYEGTASLGKFVPDEDMLENAEAEFLQSALYRQIETASATFARAQSNDKYYYDYHYPVVKTNVKREGKTLIFSFTVDVTFGRLDVATREVKDLYTITFKIENKTTFDATIRASGIEDYEIILSPINETTIGIYAKTGSKLVTDSRLEFFKEMFVKAKEDGKVDPLENLPAKKEDKTLLGILPIFAFKGLVVHAELYNVFSFEAIGKIGVEVVTRLAPTIGIANYGDGIKIIKDFNYSMTVNAYAYAKLDVSDRIGANLTVSLIGMIHAVAAIEVGPYAGAGGMLSLSVEWGSTTPFNFGASAGGYVEAGVRVDAYLDLKITTLVAKIKLYQTRFTFFKRDFVLFSVGDKELPIRFVADEGPITKTADLLYGIDLMDSIGTVVLYQNMKTLKTSTGKVSVTLEIVDQPNYASINARGQLVLNKNVGDRTYVDLKIKVRYKWLYKIVDVRVNIAHDYADAFECHDRTCRYCGYLCKATAPHAYSEWVAVSEGVCTPDPYLMRICCDCRACEFSGIDVNEAQHHDYCLVPELSVEPTCQEDGYLAYRCAREGCTSGTQVTVVKSFGVHDLIWVDAGETHYQHCKRPGCEYDSVHTDHVSQTIVGCEQDCVCMYCGNIMAPAHGHHYYEVPAQAATCTEEGYYRYLECQFCGDTEGYTKIPALGHSYRVTWKWNGFESVTAIATCANGHTETFTATRNVGIKARATCTTPGEIVHTASVTIDGVVYTDKQIETRPPLGHKISYVNAKEPTCTSPGWYAYETCSRCNHTTKQVRAQLSHQGGTASCTAKAICELCKKEYGEKAPHKYVGEFFGNEDGHYRICECGKASPIQAHVPNRSAPTETEAVICKECNYIIAPAANHVVHNFTVLCYNDNYHWYQCDGCNQTTTKLDHTGGTRTCQERRACEVCGVSYGIYGDHSYTLTSNEDMHWSVCTVCYRVTGKEKHHGGTATCDEKATCRDCGVLYGEKAKHIFSGKWQKDSESHYLVCTCGAKDSLAPHTPDRAAPTETLAVKCTVCKYVMAPATGHNDHDYSHLMWDDSAHWYQCTGCDEIVNKTSHNGGNATCTKRAMCSTCGVTYGEDPDHTYVLKSNDTSHWYACSLCDFEGFVLEHEGGYATCISRARCDECGKEYGELREHSYQYVYDAARHWEECSVCKSVSPASEHVGGTLTCTEHAKCSVCGGEYGVVIGQHAPIEDDGDCTTAVVCSVCGVITKKAQKHTFSNDCDTSCNNANCHHTRVTEHRPKSDDGDCTTEVVCRICGKVTTPARASHTGGTATCKKRAECDVCGKAYGKLSDHIPEEDDGDCTTAIRCLVCDDVLQKGNSSHTGGTATCEKKAVCIVCGEEYGDLLPHTPEADDGDCTTAVLCTVCGGTAIVAKAHSFSNGCDTTCDNVRCFYARVTEHRPEKDDSDCTTELVCLECSAVIVPARASHTGGVASCTKRANCAVCGMEYGTLKPHTPNSDDGNCETAVTCSVCSTVLVEAKTHDFESGTDYDYNDSGHWKICANRDCSMGNQSAGIQSHEYGDWYIPSHDRSSHAKDCVCGKTVWGKHIPEADDDDCTTAVACAECGLIAIQATSHNFDTEYSMNSVEHWHVCANDGCTAKDTQRAHDYGAFAIDQANSSMHVHACKRCGYTETLPHNFVGGVYVKNELYHWKQCADCNAQDTANKAEHSGTVATCTERSRCNACGVAYGALDLNNHTDRLSYDGDSHYDQCTGCGRKKNITPHTIENRVDVTERADGEYLHSFVEFCTGCEYSVVLASELVHMHEGTQTYGAVAPGCETSGYRAGLRCTQCAHIYFEPEVLPARGHTVLVDGWVQATDPTCAKEGSIGHETCAWCACALDAFGNRLTDSDLRIPKLNHRLKTNDGRIVEIDTAQIYSLSEYPELAAGCIGAPPTDTTVGRSSFRCNECGETAFVEVIGHCFTLTHDDVNHWLYCEASGCTETKEMEAHRFDDDKCTVCGCERPVAVDLEYTLNPDGESYTVSGIGDCTDTKLVIPSMYNGLPVTEIGVDAFEYCTALVSVTIPATVTKIGNYAFYECTGLVSVIFLDGSALATIGNQVFRNCGSLESIAIPAGVTSIGDYVFYGCGSLSSVTFDEGSALESMGSNLFRNCGKLASVAIPDGVTSIGNYAFCDCSALTSITIPASVKSIGTYAFTRCNNLNAVYITDLAAWCGIELSGTADSPLRYGAKLYLNGAPLSGDLVIPEGVTGIGDCAFYGCEEITSVTIPASVTSIGFYAFYGCTSLTSITIPASVTSIDYWAFEGCSSLNAVYITDLAAWCGIEFSSIDDTPLRYGAKLYLNGAPLSGDLVIPEGVTGIGGCAFYGCEGITSVTIPASVKSIEFYAFYGCTSLTSITIPASVTYINSTAFENCSSLATIYYYGTEDEWEALSANASVPASAEIICMQTYTFLDEDGTVLKQETCPVGTVITAPLAPNKAQDGENFYTFAGFEGFTEGMVLSNTVTFTARYDVTPFYKYTVSDGKATITGFDAALTGDVTIPSTLGGYPVISIGAVAFNRCTGLTSVTIGDGVESISRYAFQGCVNLTSVTIGDGVRSIDIGAFYRCSALESVTFGKNSVLTDIGRGAFSGCSLKSVTIPDSVTRIGDEAFSGCSQLATVAIGEHSALTSIGNSAFVSCRSLVAITIPDGVVSIGEGAFSNCVALASVAFGENSAFTSIGNRMFFNCVKLTSIEIPDSVVSIGAQAFSNCSGLKEIVFGEDSALEIIGSYAFRACIALVSVTFPDSVTSIGDYAFLECSGLVSIAFSENSAIVSIDSTAFKLCRTLASITLPDELTKISFMTFADTAYYKDQSNWEDGVLYIGKHLIKANPTVSGTYTVKSGTLCIADAAFSGCTRLTGVIIPDSVTSIGEYAFRDCTALTSIKLPDITPKIGNYAFFGCPAPSITDPSKQDLHWGLIVKN